jgi:hypothetical protein
MASLKQLAWQSTNWECCVCYEDHTSNGRPLTRPWATENNEMVCEDCIRQVFLDALRHDICWPARWGAEILEIAQFLSIMPAIVVEIYYDREKLMEGRHAIAREEIPQEIRGVDYQLCPWCTIAHGRENDCISNHGFCTCGASFCFVCGNAAFDRLGGFNHWSHGGCPQYGTVSSGNERFSDGEYDKNEPHLVPLGRVYGVFRYVNGNDEHFGEVYEESTKLCWQTYNHRHDLFGRNGQKYASLETRRAFACLKFNVAMQATQKVPHKGVTLRRLLDQNFGPITTAHRRAILDVMAGSNSQASVSSRDPGRPGNSYRDFSWCNEELVDDLISLRSQISQEPGQHYPFALLKRSHHLGLLHAPIGEILPMHLPEYRMSAVQWLNLTVTNFKSDDDPKNLAVFVFLEPSSQPLQLLFSSLQQRDLVLPYHWVAFEKFTSQSLLVRVRARSDPEPGHAQRPMPPAVLDRWRAAMINL